MRNAKALEPFYWYMRIYLVKKHKIFKSRFIVPYAGVEINARQLIIASRLQNVGYVERKNTLSRYAKVTLIKRTATHPQQKYGNPFLLEEEDDYFMHKMTA